MSLMDHFTPPSHLITILISSLLIIQSSFATQSDIDCLRSIRDSLQDPLNNLASWNFKNTSNEGFICKFIGIQCWHTDENRVLNIQLDNMGLKGKFPMGVIGCTSLTGLNLSNNNIHGSIPRNISKLIQFVTFLDLSYNKFSGEIPLGLSSCSYLNVLKLDNNQLTGQIPPEIGLLSRIKIFTVARNRLSGPVPQFRNVNIPAESYAGNAGLCGGPLPECKGPAGP